MSYSALSFFATLASTLLALGLAAFVLRCNKRSSSNRWLALGLLALAAHQALMLASYLAISDSWQLALLRAAYGIAAAIPPTWLGFSRSFGKENGGAFRLHRHPLLLSVTLVGFVASIPLWLGWGVRPIFIGNIGYTVGLDGWGKLLLCVYVIGLVLVLIHIENLYRHSAPEVRRKLTALVLGVFVAFSCQIIAASYSLLFGLIHPSHLLVSAAGFLGGQVMIAYAIARYRLLDSNIYVSRYVVYRSITLALVGGYLLSLGMAAEIFRRLEIHWDFLTGTLVAIAGGAALAFLLLSENMRWKAKVFIQAHFYRHKYDYREEWMEFTRHLSLATTASAVATRTAERLLKAMWVRQVAIYATGGQPGTMALLHQIGYDHPPSTLTLSPETLRMLSDTGNRLPSVGRIGESPQNREASIRDLLPEVPVGHAVPLVAMDGPVGLLLVGPELSGNPFGVDDKDLLAAVAAQAGAMIFNARLAQEVAEGRELQVLARLSAFVAHDLKNMVSMLSMLVDNAKLHMAKPDFQVDAIRTLGDVTAKMRTLLAALASPGRAEARVKPIGLALSIEGWLREFQSHVPARIRLETRLGWTADVHVDPQQLRSVLQNLVLNSIEATPDEGTIVVETFQENGQAVLVITDTGRGMTEEFIQHRLFRPFQSTKPRGLGIGLYQCRHIIQSFGGTLIAASEEGKGTRMFVRLPTTNDEDTKALVAGESPTPAGGGGRDLWKEGTPLGSARLKA